MLGVVFYLYAFDVRFIMEINQQHPRKYHLHKVIPVTANNKKDPICLNNVCLCLTKPTTFGRVVSDDVKVRLLSKNTPLMISRKHATISSTIDGVFAVTDHNSVNGVYVNGRRIKPGEPHTINVGDRIAFGCGVGNQQAEFDYILESIVSENSNKRVDMPISQSDFATSPVKRKRTIDFPSATIIESNAAQIKEQEDKIKRLSEDLQQREDIQNELQNRLQETEKGLIDKLEQQKIGLAQERNEAEEYLRDLLEKQLQEKETLLRSEYDEHIKLLQNEKDLVEKKLQEDLSNKLSEKDQLYKQQMEQQKIALEQAMFDKENDKNKLIAQLQAKEGLIEKYKSVEENQRQLETCLEELRKQIDEKESQLIKQKEETKKVEIDAKQTVIQTMEDEFTCIICQELFVEATTLPCAHTFCELCLRLWMKKKKSCPVCRRKIKGKAVRSIVLDSVVEKMIDTMDDDTKARWVVLKQERMEQKRRDDSTEDPNGVRDMIHRPDDDTEEPVAHSAQQRIDRPYGQRHSRDSYRRRSRSRSPRQRQRPYYDHRYNSNNNHPQNNAQLNYHNHHFLAQAGVQLNNNNNRYYQQDRSSFVPQHFNIHQFNAQYHPNNNNCFNCGALDHVARFCPRR